MPLLLLFTYLLGNTLLSIIHYITIVIVSYRFCQQNRQRAKSEVSPENPNAAQMQLVQRKLADEWKTMPAAQKQVYLNQQSKMAAEFKRDKQVCYFVSYGALS